MMNHISYAESSNHFLTPKDKRLIMNQIRRSRSSGWLPQDREPIDNWVCDLKSRDQKHKASSASHSIIQGYGRKGPRLEFYY